VAEAPASTQPGGAAAAKPHLSLGGLNPIFFLLGSILNLLAYRTLEPIVLAGILLAVGFAALLPPLWGGADERRIFVRLFCIYWVVAGVAAIYASLFGDYMQLNSDPGGFHELSAYKAKGFRLDDLRVLTEGSLAVAVWASAYDLFAEFGFERERYVGILVNVVVSALTGVFALKAARHIFGQDSYRFQRLTWLLGTCGLLWLFAGVHLRDGMVTLGVTVLAWAWVRFVARPNAVGRLLHVTAVSLLGLLLLPFLRAEFLYVPFALAIAATLAMLVGYQSGQARVVAKALAVVGLAGVVAYLFTAEDSLRDTLLRGNEAYTEGIYEQHGADSLGTALIVGQPLPVRLLLGSLYLYVFPIPAWGGFQLESAYRLFRSCNVLFSYVVMPLVILGGWQLWRETSRRTSGLMFCLVVVVGFTIGIAGTSLETRHLGAFFVPLFLLALVPDTREPDTRQAYQRLLFIVVATMAIVHLFWAALKFT
jgi:hypothetical protein